MMPTNLPANTDNSTSMRRTRIGLIIGLALIAGTGFAWVLGWSGERAYPGSLQSRTTVVKSICMARIRDISVKPGQSVAPGDALFQLVDVQLEERLIGKRREIAELEAEVNRARVSAEVDFAWRRRELQSEVFETQLKESALSQEKLNKQVEQLAWKDHLTNSDSNVSPVVAEVDHPFRSIKRELHLPDERRLQAMLREDAAAASTETLATQIALCEQRLKSLAALEKELQFKIRSASGVDVTEARLHGAKLELASLDSQLKELTITSPTYGTVGEIRFQPGDRVPNGNPLIEILDDIQPHVIAQFPSAEASQLRHGSKVTLIFPSRGTRIGIVTEIPPQTTSVAGGSESFVAVKIEPAGKLWPKLAIGSNVKVLLP
jgi:multidrug resistance efflux pump